MAAEYRCDKWEKQRYERREADDEAEELELELR
jgi:hypothetical protein